MLLVKKEILHVPQTYTHSPVPEETARVARAFMEHLIDRQEAPPSAADSIGNTRLRLELIDPGFDHTVLSEFRSRLLQGQADCSSGSRVLASLGRLVLVGTNVAGSPLWSFHAALVSADGIKKTGFQRDSVDRGTPWEQGQGWGRPAVVSQQKVNLHVGEVLHGYVGAMLLEWIGKGHTGGVLDQVVAIRGELPGNLWADGSGVPSNQTVSHRHLAGFIMVAIFYGKTTTIASGSVAVHGAKGYVNLSAENSEPTTSLA